LDLNSWNFKKVPENQSTDLEMFMKLTMQSNPKDRDSIDNLLKLTVFKDLKKFKNEIRKTLTSEYNFILESKVEKVSKSANWTHFS